MNDKIKDIVVTIIFLFTIISLFLINVIKKDTDISIAERRKLATMPELTTKSLFDGTYFKKFDSYVTDQFVERDAFRKIKIDIELSTKGEYNNLYLYDDYIIEEIFPLNSNSINNLTSKINYIKDTYLNDNSNIYYTIIPDKNYFVNKGNLKLDYNKLQDMMKSNLTNLNYINIFDKLTLDNYYKTDTHWKQEDLFDVANTIANQMNFDITNNNVVNTVTTFKGSYAGRLSVTKDIDTIKTISNPSTLNSSVYNYETKKYTQIYDYDKIKSLDKYDIYLSGASSIIDIVNPTSNSNRELIVFRDSYGSSLVPLLIEGYKKITVVDIRYVSSRILNNYIKFNDQDVLAYLVSYRNLLQKNEVLMNKYVKLHSNNDPIEIHYTLINGVNDDMKELDRMCKLLDRYNITIKFIRFNPINELEISKNEQLWVREISNRVSNIRIKTYSPPGREVGSSCGEFTKHFYHMEIETEEQREEFDTWKVKHLVKE